MSFLYPAFLVGALAVAIPIVLHLLRRDVAPEVPFSAVRLLQRSPIARSKRRRCGICCCSPRGSLRCCCLPPRSRVRIIAGAAGSSTVRIVAIDRSFSMGAPGALGTRCELARRAVDEAGAGRARRDRRLRRPRRRVAPPGPAAAGRAAAHGTRAGIRRDALRRCLREGGRARRRRLRTADRCHRPAARGLGGRAPGRSAGQPRRSTSGTWALPQTTSPLPDSASPAIAWWRRSTMPDAEPRSGQVRVERDGRRSPRPRLRGAAGFEHTTSRFRIACLRTDLSQCWWTMRTDSRRTTRDLRCSILCHARLRCSSHRGTPIPASTSPARSQRLRIATTSASTHALVTSTLAGREELGKYSAVVLLSTRGLDRRAWDALAALTRAGAGLLIAGSPDVEPAVLSTMFNWHPAMAGTEECISRRVVRHGSTPPDLPSVRLAAANLGQVRFR